MESKLQKIFEKPYIEAQRARGDEYLWEKFREYYNKNEYTYSKDTFVNDFSIVYKEITGKELVKDKVYYVKKLDIGKGLSRGETSTNYWLNTVIPYIQDSMKKCKQK